MLFLDEFTEFRRDAIGLPLRPLGALRVLAPQVHALNGGREKLSQRELEFVGVDTWPISTPGWHAPTGLFLDLWSDLPELSAQDSAVLHSLMDIEFLG